ncbi:MAG: bifunctional glycosyltransferase family 2/GtrA family protein [Syntrophomonas sp.]
MNIVVLIPAYRPNQKLIDLLQELAREAFLKIVVVNDGSPGEFNHIFDAVKQVPNTVLLSHSINLGKGAALKLGLDYIYGTFPDCTGVVTADADGQHSLTNILEVSRALLQNPASLVLGVRSFDKDVPLRSKFGNMLTNSVLSLFFGIKVGDTQTGLRGIPRNFIPELLEIVYNRYEFEMEALLLSKRRNINIKEVSIETIYYDENSESHFNPLLDSIKIYFVLFRYVFSSFATACIDYTVFILTFPLIDSIIISTYLARMVAIFVNFTLVRKYVFYSTENVYKTFFKYLLLVIASGSISALIVYAFSAYWGIQIIVAKIIAEGILYLANFTIQKEFIFGVKEH